MHEISRSYASIFGVLISLHHDDGDHLKTSCLSHCNCLGWPWPWPSVVWGYKLPWLSFCPFLQRTPCHQVTVTWSLWFLANSSCQKFYSAMRVCLPPFGRGSMLFDGPAAEVCSELSPNAMSRHRGEYWVLLDWWFVIRSNGSAP